MSLSDFALSYEYSPIILQGGIAQTAPNGAIPIIQILQPELFPNGFNATAAAAIDPEDFIAHFRPMPGSTLLENTVGTYPFANQATAANAVITEPLRLSMRMEAPAPAQGGYVAKLATFTNLQAQLAAHTASGGWFAVSTPAFTYTNLLLLTFRDVSSGEGQVQAAWQLDFVAPLISEQQASAAYNALMGKIAGGTAVGGDPPTWSGTQNSSGDPSDDITPAFNPGATPLQVGGAGGASASTLGPVSAFVRQSSLSALGPAGGISFSLGG